MQQMVWMQVELFLRMIVASVCGGIVGYERKHRGKGAGIRTHLVVAVASALMMIISKYGFSDFSRMLIGNVTDVKLDPSRLAAQIVTGVGFLGAGMIYSKGRNTTGLTTAAGIWATAGIGMAIGAGMYVMGLFTTLLIVGAQILFHKNLKLLKMPKEERISIVVENKKDIIKVLREALVCKDIQIEHIHTQRLENNLLQFEADILTVPDVDSLDLLSYFENMEFVKSVDISKDTTAL